MERFNSLIAQLVEKEIAKGSTLEQAVSNLAEKLKNSLLAAGLYEELRAKAQTIAAAEVSKVAAAVQPRNSRNETIAAIKAALKARGLRYSVTGGRGTSWGWISIDLMPFVYKTFENDPDTLRATLRTMNSYFGLLGASVISIPSASDYYREYIDRAAGREPSVKGEPYWD